jgi:hypothetical protein
LFILHERRSHQYGFDLLLERAQVLGEAVSVQTGVVGHGRVSSHVMQHVFREQRQRKRLFQKKKSKAALAGSVITKKQCHYLPITSLEILLHVFHKLSEAVDQALTNLRANYTHQTTTHKHKELRCISEEMQGRSSSQPTETVTSDTILDLHCEKTREFRA